MKVGLKLIVFLCIVRRYIYRIGSNEGYHDRSPGPFLAFSHPPKELSSIRQGSQPINTPPVKISVLAEQ